MIKTNSKKARENVRQYILDDADSIKERAEFHGKKLTTEDEIISYAWTIFTKEMGHDIENNYHNPNFGIFLDWARGLPLGGLFYYYCHSAVKDLGDILEETEEERAKYTEQQAEELLSRLIYREMEDANRREFLKKAQ